MSEQTALRGVFPREHRGIVLRPLDAGDAEEYAEGTRDPEVARFAHLPLPEYTPDTVRRLAAWDVPKGFDSGDLAVLSIVDADGGGFLGSLVLFDITGHQAELGFWLAPGARGRGVAVRAVAAAVSSARALGLTALVARTAEDNRASQRTLAAAGFTRTGDPEETTAPSGQRAVTLRYRLDLEEHGQH